MAILSGENIPAPDAIHELVQRFDYNLASYKSAQYNEAQLRLEFLNPFFEALGWDVYNKNGYAEAYKEVINEDAIKVGEQTKAPDYGFRIGGMRKFFVEAKKPFVHIATDAGPAFQLRRYAWSAKLPLSILTDFEELAVYDCRIKPSKTDKASAGRVRLLGYKDYAEHWSDIAGVFSRDAILKGSFDKYALSKKAKRGTAEVDAVFLDSMEEWRLLLARNLAIRNPDISHRELNYAVQQTIDRIIFLRMCEDRGIEDYGRLRAATNGPGIYGRLKELFYQADLKYNSGLFYFENEKGRGEPDNLTPGLAIDDKVLKEIITNLYYPDSPYVFSQIPAEILGQVYEQFLGKVIHVTPGRRVKVEEKPEVRKAGGVYYTPDYIVDYIVKQTVGRLVRAERGRESFSPEPSDRTVSSDSAKKTPDPLEALKSPRQMKNLRILDPACGSGSFLVAAYQYLLDKHLEWYQANEPEKQKAVFQGKGGDWFLTTDEKKSILTNCIYGVDIDPQAVEVTKLSLLLKVLEGENQERLDNYVRLFHERALPDLSDNIKCGNSLIGPDFYDNQEMGLFDDETIYRINVFDWGQAFPWVEKAGGFDAVIGNPPYIRIQTMKEWAPQEVDHYKKRYVAASKGNYDIYVVFVEKGLSLLNKNGRLGFILPHKFFNAKYGAALRGLIAKGKHLSEVVHFGHQQVFDGATTYTCLMFLDKAARTECRIQKVDKLLDWRTNRKVTYGEIVSEKITAADWNFDVGKRAQIFERLKEMAQKLGTIAHTFVGTQTSADDVFVLDNCKIDGAFVFGFSRTLGKEVQVERDCTKPFLRGKEIRRWERPRATSCLISPYEISKKECRLLDEIDIAALYPHAIEYLRQNKNKLMQRENGKFKGRNWYAFGYPKSMTLFQLPKIIVPDYNNVASFTIDDDGHFFKTGYGVIFKDQTYSQKYVLGLLNSNLLFEYLLSIGTMLRGGYVRFWTQYIEQLPMRSLNLSNPNEKAQHDRMVSLVDQMLALHQ